jgi:hypothetical protein
VTAKTPVAAAPTSAWRNRITGSGQEAPDQLLANPANWRIHPKAQQDALAGALDQVGWVQQVLVNRRTGFVVDGHTRFALALRRGEPTVPVLYVDLDPAEEALGRKVCRSGHDPASRCLAGAGTPWVACLARWPTPVLEDGLATRRPAHG